MQRGSLVGWEGPAGYFFMLRHSLVVQMDRRLHLTDVLLVGGYILRTFSERLQLPDVLPRPGAATTYGNLI